jgi:hypothetical protein
MENCSSTSCIQHRRGDREHVFRHRTNLRSEPGQRATRRVLVELRKFNRIFQDPDRQATYSAKNQGQYLHALLRPDNCFVTKIQRKFSIAGSPEISTRITQKLPPVRVRIARFRAMRKQLQVNTSAGCFRMQDIPQMPGPLVSGFGAREFYELFFPRRVTSASPGRAPCG